MIDAIRATNTVTRAMIASSGKIYSGYVGTTPVTTDVAAASEAVKQLVLQGRIKPGERVVAISGSPLAMRGATSTLRLYKIDSTGEILDAQ